MGSSLNALPEWGGVGRKCGEEILLASLRRLAWGIFPEKPSNHIEQNWMKKNLTMREILVVGLMSWVGLTGVRGGEEEGFGSLFNGKDLTGWDGRPGLWAVNEGAIRGETTATNRAPGNTFLIWRGGILKDFDLRLSYRILTGNNSGVQYRSRDEGGWVVKGYQGEVVTQLGKTGFLYDEGRRGWLTDVGDFMEISGDGKMEVVGVVANQKAMGGVPYHVDKGWNSYRIVCRGNFVEQYVNGYPTVELIDKQVDGDGEKSLKASRLSGVLALQIHGGGAMTVDFKEIRLKNYGDKFGVARRIFNGVDLGGWKGEVGKWAVGAMEEGTDTGRRTKTVGVLGVMRCVGGGEGGLIFSEAVGENYDFRFQRRRGGEIKTGGDGAIKMVMGWESGEVEVRGGKVVSYRLNGEKSAEKSPVVGGVITLGSGAAVEYRNLVVIPIE